MEINLDASTQPGQYTILTSSGIAGTFDSVTVSSTTEKTPNYTLSYLPAGVPTYVQLDFTDFPTPPPSSVDMPATVNGSSVLNPAVVCCGRPVILGPLPVPGSSSTVYTLTNRTGSLTCQIGQTKTQTYLKMQGKSGSCTIIGTKDGVVSNPNGNSVMKKPSIMVKDVMIIIAMSMVGIAHADNNNWTGFYAGMDAGVVFNNAQLLSQQLGFTSPSETCNMSSDFSTFSPGIQLGYMYQFPNSFVSSIEANATFNTNQKHTFSCNCEFNPNVYNRFTFRNQMQTSIKSRMGRVLDWNKSTFLPYLTAGASFANVGLTYQNEGGDYYSHTTTQTGWLIGVGIEWAFMQHWSLRAEYYYVDYGNTIHLQIPTVYGLDDPNGNAHIDLNSNNFAVALNYWI